MRGGREGRFDPFDMADPFNAFKRFGSFGSHRTMMPSLFGSRDPFDDPFFTRPFTSMSMFESSVFNPSAVYRDTIQRNGANRLLIEELNPDGEEDEDQGATQHPTSGKEPSVDHPDDCDDDMKIQNVNKRINDDRLETSKSKFRSFSFQTSKVSYGGVDGVYYTSSKSRTTGSDGVIIEEGKEADKTTGHATHRISRGIHDKGHSVTRKLNADGKVFTTQALHNLNEDELEDFEKTWKGNNQGHFPAWSDRFNMQSNAGSSDGQMRKAIWNRQRSPYMAHVQGARGEGHRTGSEPRTDSRGRGKKIVRINIE